MTFSPQHRRERWEPPARVVVLGASEDDALAVDGRRARAGGAGLQPLPRRLRPQPGQRRVRATRDGRPTADRSRRRRPARRGGHGRARSIRRSGASCVSWGTTETSPRSTRPRPPSSCAPSVCPGGSASSWITRWHRTGARRRRSWISARPAKAFAADRAAQQVATALDCGVLVSLGGDIALAGSAPGDGWPIRVTDDHAAGFDAPGQTVALTSGGLATSSVTVRRWNQGTVTRHHLLDPGDRTAGDRSVPHRLRHRRKLRRRQHREHCRARPGRRGTGVARRGELPARLTRHDGHVVYVGGWPDSELEP